MSVLPIDLRGPTAAVVELLKDFDVVVSCMTLLSYEDEKTLIKAASMANVGPVLSTERCDGCQGEGTFTETR